MKKSQKTTKTNKLDYILYSVVEWIKKDIIIIIVLCLALAACFITLASVDAYQAKINDAWLDQWDSVCNKDITNYKPVPVNITYKFMGDYT